MPTISYETMSEEARYAEALQRLYVRSKSGINLGLDRVWRALDDLNHPERQYRVVHIAGTNGKGSTAAMIAACLRAQGLRVGLFTSPHLARFTERIQINGEEIPRITACALIERLLAHPAALSFFEVVTVMAYFYFAEQQIDVAVMETGLGGRFDATNVCAPTVSVITQIAYDHTAILGNTLSQIAREKAGIIKTRVPVVTAPQLAEVQDVLRERAVALEAPWWSVGRDITFETKSTVQVLEPQTMRVAIHGTTLGTFAVNLAGAHQLENAAVAVGALVAGRERGLEISPRAIAAGLSEVVWPGRLERIDSFLLDVAHNPAGIRSLIDALPKTLPNEPWCIIFGAMKDKPIAEMLRMLLPRCGRLILTRVNNPRAADPATLQPLVDASIQLNVVDTIQDALALAATDVRPKVITGSVYLVGEARAALLGESIDPVFVGDPGQLAISSGAHSGNPSGFAV